MEAVAETSEKAVFTANRKYTGHLILSAGGFVIAILVNRLFAQVADGVVIKDYQFGRLVFNMNDLYDLLLIALAVGYLISGFLSYADKNARAAYIKKAKFRFACGIALALWDVTGTKLQILPQPFFPGPAGIAEAFLEEPEYILTNTLYSLRLYVAGFSLGVLFGIGTGVLIGWFPKISYWVTPVLNITGVIPAVAWMPFALTLLPTPFTAAVFLIIICAWFPIASLTAQGIMSTPKVMFEASRTLGADTKYQIFRVAIPYAMPHIFTGIGTANAFAFTTLVMAEMMGQPGGLGYYINASKVWSAYYKVFASIVVMAVLFSLISKGISIIRNRVLRWQKGLVV